MAIADSKKFKSVTRYQPGPPPVNPQDLPIYLTNELNRLGEVVFNLSKLRLEEAFAEPDPPAIIASSIFSCTRYKSHSNR